MADFRGESCGRDMYMGALRPKVRMQAKEDLLDQRP